MEFSFSSLRHAPVLLTFPVVGVVPHAHKIYDLDRNFALAENRDKTLNFLNTKCRINTN
jgi:hypothetical protein